MTTAANKVEYGVSSLYMGLYTEADDGSITLGTPVAVPGAVGITLDPEGKETTFYADNVKYYTSNKASGYTGDLEVALLSDEFKKQFMNYIVLEDGGVAELKDQEKSPVYMVFQSEGDKQERRILLYNVTLGAPKREYKTTEDKTEIATDKLDITVVGDNKTKLTKVVYGVDATGYKTIFTAPPIPKLPTVAGE